MHRPCIFLLGTLALSALLAHATSNHETGVAVLHPGEPSTSTSTSSHSTIKSSRKETDAIKAKLESTEDRVRELVAKLDSFSLDAGRVKAEIHSSLIETWQNVELLAKDRCGTELQSIRLLQKKAEAQVEKLQDEASTTAHQMEDLKLQLTKAAHSEKSVKSALAMEQSRREALEIEVSELRDKLHWASAKANETRSYDIVADRLESLLVIVTERTAMLQKAQHLLSDHHSNFRDWVREIDSLAVLVRDSNRDLTSGIASAVDDVHKRQISDLERRLKDALKSRDELIAERNDLRTSLNKLRDLKNLKSPKTQVREKSITHTFQDGVSIVGVATACVMTLICGSMLLLFCGWSPVRFGQSSNPGDDSPAGSSAVRSGPSPLPKPMVASTPGPSGFYHSPTSPMTYVGPGSGQRVSSPRSY